MIQSVLAQLGFSEKEIRIYLIVLQQGKVSLADVATLSGVNRTTVYSVAKELIKKGAIREEIGKKTYLIARSPHDLDTLIEEDRKQLHKKEHLMESAISELMPFIQNERYQIPRLSFIEEDRLEKHLYTETERWSQSIRDTKSMWVGFQDHSFVEEYMPWVDWSWKQEFSKDTQLQLFTNDSAVEAHMKKKKLERRRMQWWGEENPITSTLWVCGEYVIMIVTRTHPHYLVEIHDKLLAFNLHETFQRLWKK